jgi:hypothetical protein
VRRRPRLARRAGLPNAAISFEGIGKTDRELQMVARAAADGQPLRWLSVESAAGSHDLLATISTRLPSGSRSRALRLLFPVSCGGWTAGTPAATSSR